MGDHFAKEQAQQANCNIMRFGVLRSAHEYRKRLQSYLQHCFLDCT